MTQALVVNRREGTIDSILASFERLWREQSSQPFYLIPLILESYIDSPKQLAAAILWLLHYATAKQLFEAGVLHDIFSAHMSSVLHGNTVLKQLYDYLNQYKEKNDEVAFLLTLAETHCYSIDWHEYNLQGTGANAVYLLGYRCLLSTNKEDNYRCDAFVYPPGERRLYFFDANTRQYVRCDHTRLQTFLQRWPEKASYATAKALYILSLGYPHLKPESEFKMMATHLVVSEKNIDDLYQTFGVLVLGLIFYEMANDDTTDIEKKYAPLMFKLKSILHDLSDEALTRLVQLLLYCVEEENPRGTLRMLYQFFTKEALIARLRTVPILVFVLYKERDIVFDEATIMALVSYFSIDQLPQFKFLERNDNLALSKWEVLLWIHEHMVFENKSHQNSLDAFNELILISSYKALREKDAEDKANRELLLKKVPLAIVRARIQLLRQVIQLQVEHLYDLLYVYKKTDVRFYEAIIPVLAQLSFLYELQDISFDPEVFFFYKLFESAAAIAPKEESMAFLEEVLSILHQHTLFFKAKTYIDSLLNIKNSAIQTFILQFIEKKAEIRIFDKRYQLFHRLCEASFKDTEVIWEYILLNKTRCKLYPSEIVEGLCSLKKRNHADNEEIIRCLMRLKDEVALAHYLSQQSKPFHSLFYLMKKHQKEHVFFIDTLAHIKGQIETDVIDEARVLFSFLGFDVQDAHGYLEKAHQIPYYDNLPFVTLICCVFGAHAGLLGLQSEQTLDKYQLSRVIMSLLKEQHFDFIEAIVRQNVPLNEKVVEKVLSQCVKNHPHHFSLMKIISERYSLEKYDFIRQKILLKASQHDTRTWKYLVDKWGVDIEVLQASFISAAKVNNIAFMKYLLEKIKQKDESAVLDTLLLKAINVGIATFNRKGFMFFLNQELSKKSYQIAFQYAAIHRQKAVLACFFKHNRLQLNIAEIEGVLVEVIKAKRYKNAAYIIDQMVVSEEERTALLSLICEVCSEQIKEKNDGIPHKKLYQFMQRIAVSDVEKKALSNLLRSAVSHHHHDMVSMLLNNYSLDVDQYQTLLYEALFQGVETIASDIFQRIPGMPCGFAKVEKLGKMELSNTQYILTSDTFYYFQIHGVLGQFGHFIEILSKNNDFEKFQQLQQATTDWPDLIEVLDNERKKTITTLSDHAVDGQKEKVLDNILDCFERGGYGRAVPLLIKSPFNHYIQSSHVLSLLKESVCSFYVPGVLYLCELSLQFLNDNTFISLLKEQLAFLIKVIDCALRTQESTLNNGSLLIGSKVSQTLRALGTFKPCDTFQKPVIGITMSYTDLSLCEERGVVTRSTI